MLYNFKSLYLLILIYLFTSLLLIISTIYSNVFSLVAAPVLPLLIILHYFRSAESIYDYKIIYLLSLFIWGSGKSISLMISNQNILSFGLSWDYIILMFLCPLLVFFFKDANLSVLKGSFSKVSKFTYLFWFFSCSLYALSKVDFFNTEISFIIENIFRGFPLYFGGSILILLSSKDVKFHLNELLVMVFTMAPYSINTYNRSALMVPLSVLMFSYLANKVHKFKISFNFLILVFSVASLVFISDVMKMTDSNFFQSIEYIYKGETPSSAYIPEKDSASNYFQTLSSIKNHNPGIILYQFSTILMPRIFNSDKPETDISKILFSDGISPQPLYYEIFLEPYYDSGIFGVLFYYLIIISFSYLLFKYILKIESNQNDSSLAKSLYFLSLVTLFYSIRGPLIINAWYLFPPLTFFIFQQLFISKR